MEVGIYLQWQHDYVDCGVFFRRDSLYVVGGDLTIEAKGKLDSIPNINQRFIISTDTLAGSDTMRTKWIRVDNDPIKATFKNYLASNRARAIAWEEYAGSNDPDH